MAMLIHGTRAYNPSYNSYLDDIDSLRRIIEMKNNPQWEICVSTKPIGPVGVFIDVYTPIKFYSRNVCSSLIGGHRHPDPSLAKYEISEKDFFDPVKGCNKRKGHNEGHIKDFQIHSVWISEFFLEEYEDDIIFMSLLNEVSSLFKILVVDDIELTNGHIIPLRVYE